MINKRTFWGIPLATRRTRRWLVAGYWLIILTLLALGTTMSYTHRMWLTYFWSGPLLGLGYGFLLTFLGGTVTRGPVRDFEGRAADGPSLVENTIRTLINPADRDWEREDRPLDERDIRVRNAAHYEAYRAVKWIALVGPVVFLVFETVLVRYRLLMAPILILLTFLVYNLPQTLILWFEPDMEEPR